MAALAGYGGRAFFLYGGGDPEATQAQEAFRSFCEGSGPTAEFAVIEGANHNFYSLAWKRTAIERTVEWLAGALGA